MAVDSSRWGAKIGPRIAMLVVQAIAYSHTKLHDVKHRLAMAVFHSISDEISDEVDTTLGPFLAMLHAEIPEDHPAYPGVHFLHTASGQLKAISGSGLQTAGLLGAVSTIVNNALAPVVYSIIKSDPQLLPDAGTIVQAYNTGRIGGDEANGALRATGIQQGWSDYMMQMGYAYPAVADGLEMLRRGIIQPNQFYAWCIDNSIPDEVARLYIALESVPLSPADAALAVLRGNMSQAEGETVAKENGVSAANFATLIGNTGEPPGLQQMLEAYRRGFIDKATLERGIRESRYRDEWIPMLEQLRYAPMTTSDAVRSVVQNNMTAEAARSIAQQNGLEPGQVDILLATEGDPLSRTEMSQLYNRGLATRAQVIQALAESRLKNKYGQLAFDLHERLVDPSELARAVVFGSVGQADAVRMTMELGYSQASATMLVTAGINERIKAYRDRTVAAIAAMYENGVIDQAQAITQIQGLGHDATDANLIVTAADFHREARVILQATSAIRAKYLGHHITINEASGLIDAIGIPSPQRDYLLKLWTIERSANVRTLTEAQIVKALKNNQITADDAKARLLALGYAAGDADLLIGGA